MLRLQVRPPPTPQAETTGPHRLLPSQPYGPCLGLNLAETLPQQGRFSFSIRVQVGHYETKAETNTAQALFRGQRMEKLTARLLAHLERVSQFSTVKTKGGGVRLILGRQVHLGEGQGFYELVGCHLPFTFFFGSSCWVLANGCCVT